MSQLHELLPAEKAAQQANQKIREETLNTFSKKDEHFAGWIKKYAPFDEDAKQEAKEERKELVTTVHAKLEYAMKAFATFMDAKLQREATNQVAKADVLLSDGTPLVKDAPVTFLLGMEDLLKEWRAVLDAIGTLPPGIKWEKDTAAGPNIYRTVYPEETFRTKKTTKHTILVQPTKEHPAQIDKWTEDVPCGKFIVTKWSGLLSPAEKSVLLGRIDELILAFTQARQRANQTDVIIRREADAVVRYLLEGK